MNYFVEIDGKLFKCTSCKFFTHSKDGSKVWCKKGHERIENLEQLDCNDYE